MPNSEHEIAIRAEPNRVYAAWTTHDGLVAWWTAHAQVAAECGAVHVFEFNGGDVRFHFRIDALAPNEHVRWTGVAGDGMADELIGTPLDVRLAPLPDGRTGVRFTHGNWASGGGMYAMCNTTWGELMFRLRDWCEGRPRGPLFTD